MDFPFCLLYNVQIEGAFHMFYAAAGFAAGYLVRHFGWPVVKAWAVELWKNFTGAK